MRLGGPVFIEQPEPERWVAELQRLGYRAAYCPVKHDAAAETVRTFAEAAAAAGIVIAEVGAWSNPISRDDDERRRAIAYCQSQLALADEIGARCCVNIAGSRSARWDGPHAENLTAATFDLIVETTRAIVDAVRPVRTYFTLETMPWSYPDSAQNYVRLLRAIDRPAVAVHLDPANLISSPQIYFANAALIRDCFDKLGPWIKSCHAKDILLAETMTVHLSEVRPGLGKLDYAVFLHELARLDPETPLMLEHLPDEAEYGAAAAYIRSVAERQGLQL